MLTAVPSYSSDVSYKEDEVKVAFLYRSLQYVKWEELLNDTGTPVVVCINAPSSLFKLMNTLNGRNVASRKIIVKDSSNLTSVNDCNVAYISVLKIAEFKNKLAIFSSRNVLTINDNSSYSREGAVLNFVLNNKRISIEVNLDAAERNNIQFSAKFLRIANTFHTGNK